MSSLSKAPLKPQMPVHEKTFLLFKKKKSSADPLHFSETNNCFWQEYKKGIDRKK